MLGLVGVITDNKEFGNDTSFMGLIYLYELRKFTFIKYRRINIFIDPNAEMPLIVGEDTKACNIVFPYTFQTYFALRNEEERRNEILRIFDEGFMLLCEKLNWDKKLFSNIKKRIIEKKFEIAILIGNKKGNTENDRVYASLMVYPEIRKSKYYVNFEREDGQVFCSLLIYEGMPDWMYWIRLFKQFKWSKNNKYFFIIDDNKEISFKCQYLECKFEIVYTSHGRSIEDKEKTLKFWHYQTSDAERQRLGIPHQLIKRR